MFATMLHFNIITFAVLNIKQNKSKQKTWHIIIMTIIITATHITIITVMRMA